MMMQIREDGCAPLVLGGAPEGTGGPDSAGQAGPGGGDTEESARTDETVAADCTRGREEEGAGEAARDTGGEREVEAGEGGAGVAEPSASRGASQATRSQQILY